MGNSSFGSLCAAAGALAATFTTLATASAATQWRKIDGEPGFSGWRPALQQLVDRHGEVRRNRICIVVRADEDPQVGDAAYIYWPAGHRLYKWLPIPGQDVSETNIAPGDGELDLRRDIVPRPADLKGSTFRITLSELRAIKIHCDREGTTLTLDKEAP